MKIDRENMFCWISLFQDRLYLNYIGCDLIKCHLAQRDWFDCIYLSNFCTCSMSVFAYLYT